jgi:hypothetical protein
MGESVRENRGTDHNVCTGIASANSISLTSRNH